MAVFNPTTQTQQNAQQPFGAPVAPPGAYTTGDKALSVFWSRNGAGLDGTVPMRNMGNLNYDNPAVDKAAATGQFNAQRGSTYMSSDDIYTYYATADHSTILALQKKLEAAGYLAKDKYIPGLFDADTSQALGQATQEVAGLNQASARSGTNSVTFNEYMDQRAKAIMQAGKPPTNAQLTANPMNLKAQVQNVAESILGHGLTDLQLEDFTRFYQNLVNQATSAGWEAPDQSLAADSFIQQDFSREISAHQADQKYAQHQSDTPLDHPLSSPVNINSSLAEGTGGTSG